MVSQLSSVFKEMVLSTGIVSVCCPCKYENVRQPTNSVRINPLLIRLLIAESALLICLNAKIERGVVVQCLLLTFIVIMFHSVENIPKTSEKPIND